MNRRQLLRWYCAASVTLLVAIVIMAPVTWHYHAIALWTAKSRRSDWNAHVVYGYLVFIHFRLEPPEDPCDLPSGWGFQFAHVDENDIALFDAQAYGSQFAKLTYYAVHSGGFTNYIIMVPLWIPALLLSMAPSLHVYCCALRRRRRLQGRCLTCGYDLRASENACPECGTPIIQPSSVAASKRLS